MPRVDFLKFLERHFSYKSAAKIPRTEGKKNETLLIKFL